MLQSYTCYITHLLLVKESFSSILYKGNRTFYHICLRTDPQILQFFDCFDDNAECVCTRYKFDKWAHPSADF